MSLVAVIAIAIVSPFRVLLFAVFHLEHLQGYDQNRLGQLQSGKNLQIFRKAVRSPRNAHRDG